MKEENENNRTGCPSETEEQRELTPEEREDLARLHRQNMNLYGVRVDPNDPFGIREQENIFYYTIESYTASEKLP